MGRGGQRPDFVVVINRREDKAHKVRMIGGWTLGFLANAIIAAAYLAVAGLLATNAVRTNQWRTNTLGVATVLLYLTCGGGHAVYALQMYSATVGSEAIYATGARVLYSEAHMWLWDFGIAAVGVWYWTQRRRFPELVSGTAVFEDFRIRQRRALEVNDNIVQGLVRAKMNYELDRADEGNAALAQTREAGRRMVEHLHGAKSGGPPP